MKLLARYTELMELKKMEGGNWELSAILESYVGSPPAPDLVREILRHEYPGESLADLIFDD